MPVAKWKRIARVDCSSGRRHAGDRAAWGRPGRALWPGNDGLNVSRSYPLGPAAKSNQKRATHCRPRRCRCAGSAIVPSPTGAAQAGETVVIKYAARQGISDVPVTLIERVKIYWPAPKPATRRPPSPRRFPPAPRRFTRAYSAANFSHVSLWPRALLLILTASSLTANRFTSWRSPKCFAASISTLSEDEYYDELIGFDDKGAFKTSLRSMASSLIPRPSCG